MSDEGVLAVDDRHRRRSWVTNAGWLVAANAMSLAVSAVVGIALVRVFGASDLGRYSLGAVAGTLGGAVVSFRLDQHLVTRLRLHADDERALALAVRAAYLVYLPTAITAAAIASIAFSGSPRVIALLAIAEAGIAPALFSRAVLQVTMRQRRALIATATSRVFWLFSVGLLVVTHSASVPAVMCARIAAALVEGFCLSRLTGYGIASIWRHSASLSELSNELRASAPLAAAGLTGEFHGRVDQPMLGAVRGTAELGVYVAAVRIADLAGVIGPLTQTVVVPGLVDAARREDSRTFESVLRDGLALTLVPSAWLVALTIGEGSRIVQILVGDRFAHAARLIPPLAAAEWMTFVGAAYASGLLALGLRRTIAWTAGIGLTVNLVGNAILIHRFGAAAAAWMTLVGCTCATLVAALGARPLRRHVTATLPVVAASAASVTAAAATAWFARSSLIGSAALGSLVYVLAATALMRHDATRALHALRQIRSSLVP